MLYLLGGAARSGKTIIAQRLLKERCIPYFCIDYFVSALEQGAPELGILGESPTLPKAGELWTLLKPLLVNIIEVEPHYLVEGDTLLPGKVVELRGIYPSDVRICFLGYPRLTPEEKMKEIRQFGGSVNDWIQEHTDDYILELTAEMVDFSQYLQRECQEHNVQFFDTSRQFLQSVDQAFNYLREGISP